MRHVDVDSACLPVKVETPGFLQDLLTREHESAMAGKSQEQVKFLSPQVEAERSEADFPSGWVDCDITDMNWRCAIIF